MKKYRILFVALIFGLAIWYVWPRQSVQIKTAPSAVTPIVTPVTKVLSRHPVAEKPIINNETETALNKLGLTLKNSVGVSVASSEQPQPQP